MEKWQYCLEDSSKFELLCTFSNFGMTISMKGGPHLDCVFLVWFDHWCIQFFFQIPTSLLSNLYQNRPPRKSVHYHSRHCPIIENLSFLCRNITLCISPCSTAFPNLLSTSISSPNPIVRSTPVHFARFLPQSFE